MPISLSRPQILNGARVDPELHYRGDVGPVENADLDECTMAIANIGWTLGNDCPYRCTHCYSMSARRKGLNLEKWMVDRIVDQLFALGVKTVNVGGNEPIFTEGLDVRRTLLPYIIESLVQRGIHVGLTTSGITLIKLSQMFGSVMSLLNDVDISFDSPFQEEHDRNRGAALFRMAVDSLEICEKHAIDRTIIMCAMKWNFTPSHIDAIIDLARRHHANIRINPLKPVQAEHMDMLPTARMFYEGFARLMTACRQVDLGEPLLASATAHAGGGCPCGRTSFRIHSITPEGTVPVSPCVYLHDYKVGDLLVDDVWTIVRSPQFRSFRRRNANPVAVRGCAGCEYVETCRGGCAARSYLHHLHESGERSLFVKDPYCLAAHRRDVKNMLPEFPQKPHLPKDKILVHRDYLCTWIGEPLPNSAVGETTG
jgi:radical SAM protein with 4Fe4S-binding SPASM domain